MSAHSSHTPGESHKEGVPHHLHGIAPASGPSRRAVASAAAVVGTTALVDLIGNGAVSGLLAGSTPSNAREPNARHALDGALQAGAELQTIHVPEESTHAPTGIDWAGSALFAKGIADLSLGKGFIGKDLYGALALLLSLKYAESDSAGRHHTQAEIGSTFKAFSIIAGTVVLASGLRLDIEKAFRSVSERSPELADKVALVTMFSSVASPAVTTVGNSQITGALAREIANGDVEILSILVGHNAGRSGYLLFGDPPFIAMVNKYGFSEAVNWQITRMWPLALYSMVSATFKTNYLLAKKEGLNSADALKKAGSDTATGISKNIPVLARIVGKSLANTARYCAAQGHRQDMGGWQVMIGETLGRYAKNALDFTLAHPRFDAANPETEMGETRDPVQESHDRLVAEFLDHVEKEPNFASLQSSDVPSSPDESTEMRDEEDPTMVLAADIADRMKRAAEVGDWTGVEEIAQQFLDEQQFGSFRTMLEAYRRLSAATLGQEDEFPGSAQASERTRRGFMGIFASLGHFSSKTLNLHRFKNAAGHEIGDVLNVFLFQALCVIFLLPVFKYMLADMEDRMRAYGIPQDRMETAREASTFFALFVFSMFADNYVACVLGLELFPDKPELSLIPAIE
jgi:hypothetical protein